MDDALQVSASRHHRSDAHDTVDATAHVLVVDDNTQVLELCRRFLEAADPLGPIGLGTESHFASSGEEALATARDLYARGECIAYAVLDFILPDGPDGVDTIRALWELDPRIHCTLITGAEERLETGVQERLPEGLLDRWDYLAKPFDRFQFTTAVRRALSSWWVRRLEEGRAEENRELLHCLESMNKNLEQSVRERTDALARRTEDAEQKSRELEKALHQLGEAQAQLLQQEKMASIGQLAAGVAHELNNPISYVSSNLNTLERYIDKVQRIFAAYEERIFPEGDPQNEDLLALKKELKVDYVLEDLPALVKESLEGTERVRKIVSDLKGFSRPDENQPKYSDINDGLMSTLNIVRNEIKYRAEIITELGEIPPVLCVPGQVNQVFMNLLVNAGQAIEDNGEVRITTRTDGDDVVVEVRDTGCGISDEHLKRVFDPFFTTKGVGKGTGLGLSISCDIVRRHGGELSVESELGKGTCFTVRLPVEGNGLDQPARE